MKTLQELEKQFPGIWNTYISWGKSGRYDFYYIKISGKELGYNFDESKQFSKAEGEIIFISEQEAISYYKRNTKLKNFK